MQFLIDGVNQENKNNKNFFTLDENLLLISLKENEALKFLTKVSKEETLFSQFISNINYRGMYQLYESTKTISVGLAHQRDFESNVSALVKLKRMLNGVSKIAGASDTLVRAGQPESH